MVQGSKQGAAKVISYCRNGEKKHGDMHYTFTSLTKLKKESLSYRFIRCYFLFLAMEFLLGVFIGFFLL